MIRPCLDTRGYTLLEVMVALLIVAMSLGAVFQNVAQSNRAAIRSQTALTSVRLAQTLFNDTEAVNAVLRGDTIDRNVPGEEDWQYRLYSEPVILETLPDQGEVLELETVKKIVLCLRHGPEGRQQSFCYEKWRRQ